jgi:hypothetical protein
MQPKSSPSVLLNKKGRRTFGAYYTFPDGRQVYMAWRNSSRRRLGIFLQGLPDISTAIRSGKACWAIDEEDLINCRANGIKFVGVLDKATGDKYMTTLDKWFSDSAVYNYSSRGGSLQRYLPLQHFRRQVGKSKV